MTFCNILKIKPLSDWAWHEYDTGQQTGPFSQLQDSRIPANNTGNFYKSGTIQMQQIISDKIFGKY